MQEAFASLWIGGFSPITFVTCTDTLVLASLEPADSELPRYDSPSPPPQQTYERGPGQGLLFRAVPPPVTDGHTYCAGLVWTTQNGPGPC